MDTYAVHTENSLNEVAFTIKDWVVQSAQGDDINHIRSKIHQTHIGLRPIEWLPMTDERTGNMTIPLAAPIADYSHLSMALRLYHIMQECILPFIHQHDMQNTQLHWHVPPRLLKNPSIESYFDEFLPQATHRVSHSDYEQNLMQLMRAKRPFISIALDCLCAPEQLSILAKKQTIMTTLSDTYKAPGELYTALYIDPTTCQPTLKLTDIPNSDNQLKNWLTPDLASTYEHIYLSDTISTDGIHSMIHLEHTIFSQKPPVWHCPNRLLGDTGASTASLLLLLTLSQTKTAALFDSKATLLPIQP